MFLNPITEDEVLEVIKNLDAKKSTGHDGFSILIIKKFAAELTVPLTLIFNLSIKDGIVPDQLKIARVVPIHKKKKKLKIISLIIGQFQYCLDFPKYLKDLSLIDVFYS